MKNVVPFKMPSLMTAFNRVYREAVLNDRAAAYDEEWEDDDGELKNATSSHVLYSDTDDVFSVIRKNLWYWSEGHDGQRILVMSAGHKHNFVVFEKQGQIKAHVPNVPGDIGEFIRLHYSQIKNLLTNGATKWKSL